METRFEINEKTSTEAASPAAHERHGCILLEQREVRLKRMRSGDCVEDEVERIGMRLHLRLVGGEDDFVGAQGKRLPSCGARW